ncbi:MAG: phosphatase PAP2 family protein [Flavobacteriaceae bacterium]|nr:phosphatase PAP2 family protein [Flavobacteriaceae bacterium]
MKLFLYSFLMFLLTSPIMAQQDSFSIYQDSTMVKGNILQDFKYDIASMGGGFVNSFIQPFRWEKDDYLIAGATITGVSLLYLFDEESSRFFQRQRNDIPELVLDSGWYFGRPEFSYGLTAGIYLYGLFSKNEKVREAGVLLVTSAAATGVFQQTMKTITGRARPGVGKGKNQFRLFKGGNSYGSFPSGHTILSTTTVYGLSKQFSNPWVKGGLYAVGLITPTNRLVEGAHWLTDVVLSVVVSVAIVEGVDSYLKRNKRYNNQEEEIGYINKSKNNRKINWNLTFGASTVGLAGSF